MLSRGKAEYLWRHSCFVLLGHQTSTNLTSVNQSFPKQLMQYGALGKTRTSNLLIRSQMLYPLSYERWKFPLY